MEKMSVEKADAPVPGRGTFLYVMQCGENWPMTLKGMFFPRVKECIKLQRLSDCKVYFVEGMVEKWLKHKYK